MLTLRQPPVITTTHCHYNALGFITEIMTVMLVLQRIVHVVCYDCSDYGVVRFTSLCVSSSRTAKQLPGISNQR